MNYKFESKLVNRLVSISCQIVFICSLKEIDLVFLKNLKFCQQIIYTYIINKIILYISSNFILFIILILIIVYPIKNYRHLNY